MFPDNPRLILCNSKIVIKASTTSKDCDSFQARLREALIEGHYDLDFLLFTGCLTHLKSTVSVKIVMTCVNPLGTSDLSEITQQLQHMDGVCLLSRSERAHVPATGSLGLQAPALLLGTLPLPGRSQRVLGTQTDRPSRGQFRVRFQDAQDVFTSQPSSSSVMWNS